MVDLFGLAGRGALVVGGGFGMGRASADLLARAGAAVAVLDVQQERAEAAAARIAEQGGRSLAIVADVLDRGQVDAAVQQVAEGLGSLDVVVNIVGAANWAPLTEMSDEQWDEDLSRNLRYFFHVGRAFARLPNQRPRGRAIVNIASIAGITAAADHAAYGAGKAALIALTRTMAVEWGPKGIRVNSIAPGTIETDSHRVPPEARTARAAAIPLGRVGEQEDIARVVLFLASDLAGYMTGQTLVVDGGILCRTPLPLVAAPQR
jgi:3-oxoacyl-[acyl-carrier protein] reductase